MERVLETNDDGVLSLPSELLHSAAPHTRFQVSVHGDTITIRPLDIEKPFWMSATPQQRAEDFLEWVRGLPPGPGLPDWAVSRDSIYD
jgi:hypothetical protein